MLSGLKPDGWCSRDGERRAHLVPRPAGTPDSPLELTGLDDPVSAGVDDGQVAGRDLQIDPLLLPRIEVDLPSGTVVTPWITG